MSSDVEGGGDFHALLWQLYYNAQQTNSCNVLWWLLVTRSHGIRIWAVLAARAVWIGAGWVAQSEDEDEDADTGRGREKDCDGDELERVLGSRK